MPRRWTVLLCALVSIMLSACERTPALPQQTDPRPLILATTGMLADTARALAGEHARVESLMGPGIDPHLYKPTRNDIERLSGASLVLANGLHLEGKLLESLDRLRASGTPVLLVCERIDQSLVLHDGDAHDPHLWMDPLVWKETIAPIRDAIAGLLPDHAATVGANSVAYAQELDALHAFAIASLSTVPQSQRVLITAHDAFAYFGRRYEFDVMGIQGLSTESEAGIVAIESLVRTLVERKVPAVFVESTVSERYIRALVAGAAAQQHTVVIGPTLYSDAMGEAGTPEGTYLGMIRWNVTSITTALGGMISQTPAKVQPTPAP